MSDDSLELSESEKDIILTLRTAAEAKKQSQTEKPVDTDEIVPGMSSAAKKRVVSKILELWR